MKNRSITIALAEDHAPMRQTIADLLHSFGFNVVLQAQNGRDLLYQLAHTAILPTVCLLGINMPDVNGYDVANSITKHYPSVKIGTLTMNKDPDSLLKMLQNGSSTYLVKDSDPKEWKKAIEALVTDGFYVTEWMGQMLLEHVKKSTVIFYQDNS